MKVLFIFAHVDDAEIYSGGLMLKLHKNNIPFDVVICTTSHNNDMRKNIMMQSLGAIAENIDVLDFVDGELEFTRDAFKKYIELCRQKRYSLIVTHNPNDYHEDHRMSALIGKKISSFLVPIVYADNINGVDFSPKWYCDITDTFEKKLELISRYGNVTEEYLPIIKVLNNFRGLQYYGVASKFCEAYDSSSFHLGDLGGIIWRIFNENNFY